MTILRALRAQSFGLRLALAIGVAAPSSRAQEPAADLAPSAQPAPTKAFGPPLVGDLPPPPPPRPLGETLKDDAKRDYDAALLLYQSGDFAGAAQRFMTAYETSDDVRLLWNAAACEQALRHYSKAIVLVRRYLHSRSPLITEEAERNAHAFLNAAVPLTARLVVESSESGGRVYLDDELLGTLPLDPETRTDFGTHRLIVRKSEFVDFSQTFTVTSSADQRLKVKLEPVVHQGHLVVRAGKGDSISLDGRFLGLGAFDGPVTSGSHVLRVAASGARTFEARIVIEDDRTRAIDVTLEQAPVTSGVPAWAWIAGGAVLVAGASTAGYFLFRQDDASGGLSPGTMGLVQLR